MRWVDYVGELGIYIGYASLAVTVAGLLLSWQDVQPAGVVGLFFGISGASVAMVLGMVVAGAERFPGGGTEDDDGELSDGEQMPGSGRRGR